MKTDEIAALAQAAGLAWFLWRAWTADLKFLCAVTVIYVGLAAAVLMKAVELDLTIAVALLVAFVAMAGSALVNLGTLWMPLAVIVASAAVWYRERPDDARPPPPVEYEIDRSVPTEL